MEDLNKDMNDSKKDELEDNKLQNVQDNIEGKTANTEVSDLEVTNLVEENKFVEDDNQAKEEISDQQFTDSIPDTLINQLNGLRKSFNEKLKYDKHKEEIIDKLHDENQQYKKDIIKKIQRSILKDFIFLIDDINKIISKYESEKEDQLDFKKLLRYFKEVPDEIEELLYKYDVLPQDIKVGEPFNPKFQKALKSEFTNNETEDRTIATILKKGYSWENEKFRQAEVTVFKYEPQKQTEEVVDETLQEEITNQIFTETTIENSTEINEELQ